MIDSNKNIALQDNAYITCGNSSATWTFDDHTYSALDEFRNSTGQEQGSSCASGLSAPSCPPAERSAFKAHAQNGSSNQNRPAARGATAENWTVVSELAISIDSQGLLDAASVGQLMILKNLGTQYRASGLRLMVSLDFEQANARGSLQNIIHDLDLTDINVSEPAGHNIPLRATTRLIAPDGSVVEKWQEFVGPAEIGLAVRRMLGEPRYFEMKTEVK